MDFICETRIRCTPGENNNEIMDSHTSTTLDALERTAAWVQQVQNHVEELKNSPCSGILVGCIFLMTY